MYEHSKSSKAKQYHSFTFIDCKCIFSLIEIKFDVTKRQSFTLLDNTFSKKKTSNLHENSQSIALLYNRVQKGNNLYCGETNITAIITFLFENQIL